MKKALFLFSFFILISLASVSYSLSFCFFIEPRFSISKVNPDSSYIYIQDELISRHTRSGDDSFNIFAGRLTTLNPGTYSDSLIVNFLNHINCDFAAPTDYLFHFPELVDNFTLLASNLSLDIESSPSDNFLNYVFFNFGDKKIALFAVYTPDLSVKFDYSNKVSFEFEVFRSTVRLIERLSSEADFVIMLSSLSRFLDDQITRENPVDVVVSFDYQRAPSRKLSNGITDFYSILSSQNEVGYLDFFIESDSNKLSYTWKTKNLLEEGSNEKAD